ncbi:MAG: general secretion pathway protein [Pusillimonas sp.]|nr:general secretion pathway protein [Pusillimonas sp.]
MTFADAGVLRFMAWRFQPQRADYYEYLSCLMAGAQGRLTLKDVFERDADRYGLRTARGYLSAHWYQRYPRAGGDLSETWGEQLPPSECVVIRAAQQAGNRALVNSLHDLAHACRLINSVRTMVGAGLLPALVAMLVLVTMAIAMPLFTVPRLQQVFASLPDAYYGETARSLFVFAAQVQQFWWLAPGVLVLLIWLVAWSLSNLVGPVRVVLDASLVWRLYRLVQTMRFLAVLVVLLEAGGTGSVQLRTALEALRAGSTRWMEDHLCRMLTRIDTGVVGARSLDTGLLDRDLLWYLEDMTMARSLVDALTLTRQRLEQYMLGIVRRQVAALRWCVLLACTLGVLALGLWHYAAIDDLRRALMVYYATY